VISTYLGKQLTDYLADFMNGKVYEYVPTTVGRYRLTLSKPVLKAPLVSAISA
jgi:hypothetical protein